ncbi:MAG: GDSL-type esterase/lipase family protein [Pseudomonadales bacterium]
MISWLVFRTYQELGKRGSEDPLVWEADIVAFETAARSEPPPENAVVFVGSSSIRFWDSLVEDMAPIPVIQRGFGGAKLNDVVHYADRLVNVYQPSAVVIFAGSNDMTPGDTKTPAQLLASYKQFVAKVRIHNPALPIYYIAITPSPRRWEIWPNAHAANAIIKEYSGATSGLFFIDTGQALMDADGEPDMANYRIDKLHLSEQGYKVWTRIVRAKLLETLPE